MKFKIKCCFGHSITNSYIHVQIQPVRLASDVDGLDLELEAVHRWRADCYGW